MPSKKSKRLLLILCAAILFLACLLQLSVNIYFNNKIRQELIEKVNKGGRYHLSIDRIRVNIFTRSAAISGILLIPGQPDSVSQTQYTVSSELISLKKINLLAFIFKRNVSISELSFENSSIKIKQPILRPKKAGADSTSVYDMLRPFVNSVSIGNAELDNADILVVRQNKDTVLSSKRNSIIIKNLDLNSEVDRHKRKFKAEELSIAIHDFSYIIADRLYELKAKEFRASYIDRSVKIDSLQLLPRFSKEQFAKEAGHQTDRITVLIPFLNFEGMNVKLFMERGWLISSALYLDKPNVIAYRDKNIPRKEVNVKSLQRVIKEIPFYVSIDSVHVKDAYIRYEEVAPGQHEPGKLPIEHVDAEMTGLINDSDLITSSNKLIVDAHAKMMNNGEVNTHLEFPLLTNETVFSCRGNLKSMPLNSVNTMLEKNGGIKIISGKLDKMEFSFTANESAANGTLTFLYHDLNMELVNEETEKTDPLKKFISLFVHAVVLKEENPSKGKKPRTAEIHYLRNPHRFIFNYSWKALLSGIKSSLGLKINAKGRKEVDLDQ